MKGIFKFLLGFILGSLAVCAIETFDPAANASSYACYQEGNYIFKTMIDVKRAGTDRFYPLASIRNVGIKNLKWWYHTRILRDVKKVLCDD